MKSFTKQSLTKRMMAIILSLLFAVSSFTIAGFVPTMEAQAATTLNIAGHGVASYNGGRYSSSNGTGYINVVNDGQNTNSSVGLMKFDLSGLQGKKVSDTTVLRMKVNAVWSVTNNQNCVDGLAMNVYYSSNLNGHTDLIKATGSTYSSSGSSTVTGINYGSNLLSGTKTYFGLNDSNLIGSIAHTSTSEVKFNIADAINSILANNGTAIYFVLVQNKNDGTNGGPPWSDTELLMNQQWIEYDEVVDPNANLIAQWLVDKDDITADSSTDSTAKVALTNNGASWQKANGVDAVYFDASSTMSANISSILNTINMKGKDGDTSGDGVTISFATYTDDTNSSAFSLSNADAITTSSDVIGNRVISYKTDGTARISCNSGSTWNSICTVKGTPITNGWDYWSIVFESYEHAYLYKNGAYVGAFANSSSNGGGTAVIWEDMLKGASNSANKLVFGATPLDDTRFEGYIRDFRIYNSAFESSQSESMTTIYNDMKSCADATAMVETVQDVNIIDASNFASNGFQKTDGTEDVFEFTDSLTSVKLKGIMWSATKEYNNSAGYIKIDNSTLSTPSDFDAVGGDSYSVSMKYYWDGTTDSKSTSETVFGLGNGTTADILFIKRGGSVYICGAKSQTSLNNDSDIKCTNNTPRTMTFKYDNGVAKILVDGVEKLSYNIPSANQSTVKNGVKNLFVGTSARNYAGGSWSGASGDTNTGQSASAIRNFTFYNLTGKKTVLVPSTETTVGGNTAPPSTDNTVDRTANTDSLKSSIASYEDKLAEKLIANTYGLANASSGFQTYMNAKAILDKATYGNGATQTEIDNAKSALDSATTALNSSTYFSSKAKDYDANYWSRPFASSENLSSPSSHYSNVAYFNTSSNESASYNIRDYNGYQGNIKYNIPNAVGIYTGTKVKVPVMFGYTRNDHWYYMNFSSNDVNLALSNDNWRYRDATGTLDYGWQNNGSVNAMSTSSSNTTTYQSADGASNSTYRYYSNGLLIEPKSNSTDALIKITSLTSNVKLNVNQVGTQYNSAVKIGSGQNASLSFSIYVLNYKLLTDLAQSKSMKNYGTKDKVLSVLRSADVNDSAMLTYLKAFEDANNFVPYKVNGENSGEDISRSSSVSDANARIETIASKMTDIINRINSGYAGFVTDSDYTSLRNQIKLSTITTNDKCYSGYEEYAAALKTAMNAISAPADETNGQYGTQYQNTNISAIANALSTKREALVEYGEHYFAKYGVLNKDTKNVEYECLRQPGDSTHVGKVGCQEFMSAADSLGYEITKTEKYTQDAINDATGVIGANTFTTEEGSESDEIKVKVSYDNIQTTLQTYTTNLLSALTDLQIRDNLKNVTIKYKYIIDSDEHNIIEGQIDENLKYGDVIRDSYHVLASNEHVYKWVVEKNGTETPLSYNPTTNLNYTADGDATLNCYIETDNREDEDTCTVQFIDKAGRVRAIQTVPKGTIFTVNSNKVTTDKFSYEGDKLPYYQIRGYKVGATGTEINSGGTFTVNGNANIYTVYEAGTPIVITAPSGDFEINYDSSISKYDAKWDEVIRVSSKEDSKRYLWFADGVLIGSGVAVTFRANKSVVLTAKNPDDYQPTTEESDAFDLYGDNVLGRAKVDYFKYDESLNKVTAVVTFAAFNKSNNQITQITDKSNFTEAGVILSTKASTKDAIIAAGKKYSSTKFTDTGNQVAITVSRTAKTAFTMYALPYVIVNGNTYYGTVAECIYAGPNA